MVLEVPASAIWACSELQAADLGDERRNVRLARIVTALADHPEGSLPQALEDWAAVKAAYRFFDNPHCQPEAILKAHRQRTLQRIAGRDMILLIQDTTALSFTTHRATKGLGSIGAKGLRGFFQHSALAVSVDGIPLGLLGWHTWKREEQDESATRAQRQKESRRWLDMLRTSTADLDPRTQVLTVADREADFYDFFRLAIQEKQHVLIRAAHDRPVSGEGARLWATAEAAEPLGPPLAVRIPRSGDRPERMAQIVLRAVPVLLEPPRYRRQEALPCLRLTAILALEVDPPEGEDPVKWLLLTTLTVTTYEQAAQCLRWYTYRWRVERFHFTLKSGCQIEKLQLETAYRLRTALAVYLPVAWRLLHLTYVAREEPEQPCTLFLTQPEWQALYARIHRTRDVPDEPPMCVPPSAGSLSWGAFGAGKATASRASKCSGGASAA